MNNKNFADKIMFVGSRKLFPCSQYCALTKGTQHLYKKIFVPLHIREGRRHWRQNRLTGHTSMLNENAGQFYRAAHCWVTRQLKTKARMGLKTENLALEQSMYR